MGRGLVPKLPALDHAIEHQLLQHLGNLVVVYSDRLDLLLDVLFLVGQELIGLTVPLDVGLLSSRRFRASSTFLRNFAWSWSKPSIIRTHRFRTVALNSLTYLTRKRASTPPDSERIVHVLLGNQDTALNLRFQNRADALEHEVERGQLTKLPGWKS